MSSGSRATTMYVARPSIGIPSSGVCVFTNRRWGCAASRSNNVAAGVPSQSIQGDICASGSGKSDDWKTSNAQIICIQVVPLFDRVLITMSPGRKSKSSQRPLSSSGDR